MPTAQVKIQIAKTMKQTIAQNNEWDSKNLYELDVSTIF